jgi:hypothetical protein
MKDIKLNLFLPVKKVALKNVEFPGQNTVGFVSKTMQSGSSALLVQHEIIYIGKSKKGKEAIKLLLYHDHLFDFDREVLNKFVRIDDKLELLPKSDHLNDLSNVEFLCWLHAYSRYLADYSGVDFSTHIWPKSSGHLLNRMLDLPKMLEISPKLAIDLFLDSNTHKLNAITMLRDLELNLTRNIDMHQNTHIKRLIINGLRCLSMNLSILSATDKKKLVTKKLITETIKLQEAHNVPIGF